MALPDYTTQDAATYKGNIDVTVASHDALVPSVKLVNDTAVTLSSTASVSFTIPSGVKRITLMFSDVVLGVGTFAYLRLGDSGGVEASNYSMGYSTITSAGVADTTTSTSATGFFVCTGLALGTGATYQGSVVLNLMTGTTWICNGQVVNVLDAYTQWITGKKTLTTELTTLYLVPASGSFTSGSINVQYDG